MKQIHQKSLDVAAVVILIRHHHHTTITERLPCLVLGALAEAENRLDGRELLILVELLLRDVLDVEELASQRKHSVALTSDHVQA